MTRAGRLLGALATAAMALLLMVTSLWGSDDLFPFVPFKMYSHAHDLDGWSRVTRLELVNAEGERFEIDDEATGFRKAELEGQLSRFREDPELLGHIAEAYETAHPDEPAIVAAEIWILRYELEDGHRTGVEEDILEVAWTENGLDL